MTAYCELYHLTDFLTIDEGELTGTSWPDSQVLQRNIDMAGAEIDGALAAFGQLSCSKDAWATEMLKLLNIVGAALLTEFDNARTWTDETKRRYQEWKDNNLMLIRTGDLVLCSGETNKDYPAFERIEQAWDDHAAAKIYLNYLMRNF